MEDVNEFMHLLDSNTFEFSSSELLLKFIDEFFYDGYLFDTHINNEQAEKFFKKNSEYFEILAEEHIKKINELKLENEIQEETVNEAEQFEQNNNEVATNHLATEETIVEENQTVEEPEVSNGLENFEIEEENEDFVINTSSDNQLNFAIKLFNG